MALAWDKACAVKLRTRMKPLPSRAGLEATTGATVTATNVRWVLLSLMFILSMVTYLDRVNISIAARYMTVAYGLTDVQMGKIFSAFILAYGLFQLPGGWLGDRYGPRIVLTAAIVWWSIFTIAAVRTMRDRKSTRLNYSHLVISYAVFCLKKKKKTR